MVARDVLGEGTEMSRNLRELSASLRNNAERLLRDVRLAHGGMTARLDQASPGGTRTREADVTNRRGPAARACPTRAPTSSRFRSSSRAASRLLRQLDFRAPTRGYSSVGRASGWQPEGHRFEPG